MGLYDSSTFSAPNLQMGDSNGGMLRDLLNYKEQQRQKMRQEADNDQQLQFQRGLQHLRQQNEMQNLASVIHPSSTGGPGGVVNFGTGSGAGGQQPSGGVSYPPGYNPNDPFGWEKQDQQKVTNNLELEKLALLKDKTEDKNLIDQRTVGVKERLAALKDMPDSQKAALLQQGKVSLQEIRDADAMKRTEAEVAGRKDVAATNVAGRKDVVNIQGQQKMDQIKTQGDLQHSYITQHANEARTTKAAPAAQNESQKKAGLQMKAMALANQNPDLADLITFNDQGLPVISSDAKPEQHQQIYQALYGDTQAVQDTNLPVDTGTPTTSAEPTKPATPVTTTQPANQPVNAAPQKVIKQYSPSRDQTRISTDGGLTWKIVPGKQ